jgi:hypothetical protein
LNRFTSGNKLYRGDLDAIHCRADYHELGVRTQAIDQLGHRFRAGGCREYYLCAAQFLQCRLLDALGSMDNRILSSISLLEAGMVLRARNGEAAVVLLYQLVSELVTEIVPFDQAQARLAIQAFSRFGTPSAA